MWQRHVIQTNGKVLRNICSPSSHSRLAPNNFGKNCNNNKPDLSLEWGNSQALPPPPRVKISRGGLGSFLVQRHKLRNLIKSTDIGNRYLHIDQTNCFQASAALSFANDGEQLEPTNLSKNEYEAIAEDTLESLTGYFDEIIERSALEEADANYGSGVLTVKLGGAHGTYVINKQTPNKQIWLSSPSSGPKRYDFINQTWIYRHDGMSLYQLLNSEIPNVMQSKDIDFESHCSYGKAKPK